MERNDDPLFKYSIEELQNMSREDFCAVIEESNEYVRRKHSQINEQEMPRFNTVEELMDYYDAIPFDDAINNMNKLFEKHAYNN